MGQYSCTFLFFFFLHRVTLLCLPFVWGCALLNSRVMENKRLSECIIDFERPYIFAIRFVTFHVCVHESTRIYTNGSTTLPDLNLPFEIFKHFTTQGFEWIWVEWTRRGVLFVSIPKFLFIHFFLLFQFLSHRGPCLSEKTYIFFGFFFFFGDGFIDYGSKLEKRSVTDL